MTIVGYANPDGSGDGNWSIPIPVYNGTLCEAGVSNEKGKWVVYFLVGFHRQPIRSFDLFQDAFRLCKSLNERVWS